jgi:hypothetical protein
LVTVEELDVEAKVEALRVVGDVGELKLVRRDVGAGRG